MTADIKALTQLTTSTVTSYDKRCEYGLQQCERNEECVPIGSRRRDGFCKCLSGYHRVQSGDCVKTDASPVTSENTTSTSGTEDHRQTVNTPTPIPTLPVTVSSVVPSQQSVVTIAPNVPEKPVNKLVVSINNKTVYLPADSTFYEDRVTLSAYAIGGTV